MKIWVIKLFKHFFFTLDSVLFNFIPAIYNLLMSISRTTIFSQAQIHEFATRIQMLLGIFMLFKVSFSLIMYVVNPDDFSDKSKGIGKLAQNTVISLIMLAVVPYIFNMAFKLQAMVLEDNTLVRVILGNPNEKENLSYINTAGDTMAFEILTPFFLPNTAIQLDEKEGDMVNCVNLIDIEENSEEDSGVKINNDCLVALNIAFGENEGENKITTKDSLEDNLEKAGTTTLNYVQGIQHKNIGLFFRIDALSATYTPDGGEEEFVIDYNWPITTAVAIVVLLVLLNYCIDVALRSVKLAFLQLISPIPIISYMDPKSGKDGMFSKWAKMCMSTYISLFVRLLALYFGVYIITQVGEMYDVVNGSVVDDFLVKVFIIIGVLFFIKQLPKILENMGIKLDGDGKFTLNPFKKIQEGAIGGKTISRIPKAAAGAAMGLGMGAIGTATGAGAGKWFTGMASGLKGGLTGKKMSEIHKGQVDANSKMRTARLNGSTLSGRLGARMGNITGSGGELAQIEREKDEIETQQKKLDNEIKAIEDKKKAIQQKIAPTKQRIADRNAFADAVKSMEKRAKEEIQNGNGGDIGRNYLAKKAEYERLKASGASSSDIANAEKDMNDYLNDVGMKAYMTQAISGTFSDGSDDKTFKNIYDTAKQKGTTIGITLSTDGSTIHSQFGATKGDIGNDERSIYAEEQKIASYDNDITRIEGQKAVTGDKMRDVEKREQIAKSNKDAIGK